MFIFLYSIKYHLFLKILKCSKIYQESHVVLITFLEQVSWIFMVRYHSFMFQILVVWRENSAWWNKETGTRLVPSYLCHWIDWGNIIQWTRQE